MYDQIIGEWLVVIGAGGFLLWLAARVYHATRDAARKTSRANLRRVITGEEYAHIWHEARGCGCEDDDCWWCAARVESVVRHPAGKGLRMEELLTDKQWYHDAACREYGPGLFEPAPGSQKLDYGQIIQARQICDTCPLWVREACLDDALARDDRTTIRAGLTPEQREQITRKRKAMNRGRGGHKLAPCGTYGAYKRHVREGEELCQPCIEGFRAYNRQRRAAARRTA